MLISHQSDIGIILEVSPQFFTPSVHSAPPKLFGQLTVLFTASCGVKKLQFFLYNSTV